MSAAKRSEFRFRVKRFKIRLWRHVLRFVEISRSKLAGDPQLKILFWACTIVGTIQFVAG